MIADFDELTNGLHPGQMIVVAARPAVGKALALDTPLPTPTGWTTMGEVAVGDLLLGADGRPTRVVAATDVMRGRPCFEVELSDGSVVVADAEHQWCTTTAAGATAVRTTSELAATLWVEPGPDERRLNHSVPDTAPLDLPEAELQVPPYVLGSWLGARVAAAPRPAAVAAEIAMYVESQADPRLITRLVGGLDGVTDGAGSWRLPTAYLRSSEVQRRALLVGLLDQAGLVTMGGCVQVRGLPSALAGDVRELVVSLGLECGLTAAGADRAGTLAFCCEVDAFRVESLRLEHKERRAGRPESVGGRAVVDVRRVASVPVRCVEVDSDDHLYLAGPTMVATHNSTLGLDIARAAAIKHNMTTCVFSLEMSRNEITMRLLSAEARVALHHMRTGKLTDDDWTRLARRMGEVSNAPLFIDDSPNMSMMEIRAKCRRLKQRNDLKLVIIDYLQLMQSGKRVESRQQEVSEFSRALKLLAKELEVPVIAISQLNRGPEQRTDKKPQMSDLRESGSIEQDADMVVLLHREELYERESPRAGEADFIVAKHRNGPTATITVAFQGHYSRFVDMAQS